VKIEIAIALINKLGRKGKEAILAYYRMIVLAGRCFSGDMSSLWG
jgi:hypothetical protein